jgi:hypothetical protein
MFSPEKVHNAFVVEVLGPDDSTDDRDMWITEGIDIETGEESYWLNFSNETLKTLDWEIGDELFWIPDPVQPGAWILKKQTKESIHDEHHGGQEPGQAARAHPDPGSNAGLLGEGPLPCGGSAPS